MPLESPVDVSGQDVLQVLALREELAAGQGRDGVRVGQVQLEVDDVAPLEGLLGVFRDEVPNSGVGDVDRAVEVRGGVPLDGPQEGVQLGLLQDRNIRTGSGDQAEPLRLFIRETNRLVMTS